MHNPSAIISLHALAERLGGRAAATRIFDTMELIWTLPTGQGKLLRLALLQVLLQQLERYATPSK